LGKRPTRRGLFATWDYAPSTLYGGKVAGLIWITFAAEVLRFSIAKPRDAKSRSTLRMWKCKVKSIIISCFESFKYLPL